MDFMKTVFKIGFVVLAGMFFTSSCTQKKEANKNTTIIVDVTQKYSKRKMFLQDIAEVTYLPLETTDEFLWKGSPAAFTDQYIVNYNHSNGDILIFNRQGKTIRKINRRGGGAEEYGTYCSVLLDEEKSEIYVNDRSSRKIMVYDLEGRFKRTLPHPEKKTLSEVRLFDQEHFIGYNKLNEEEVNNSYLIFSKTTGKVTDELTIPWSGEQKLSERYIHKEGENTVAIQIYTSPLSTNYPDLILNEISNDTIFAMDTMKIIRPVIIQHPSRPTMNPEVFILFDMDCKDYLFFTTVEKKFTGSFPNYKAKWTHLVYDKNDLGIYEQEIYNRDYSKSESIELYYTATQLSPTNRYTHFETLEAIDLIEALENNQLEGELKEIAKGLDEDDNPVLLIAQFK